MFFRKKKICYSINVIIPFNGDLSLLNQTLKSIYTQDEIDLQGINVLCICSSELERDSIVLDKSLKKNCQKIKFEVKKTENHAEMVNFGIDMSDCDYISIMECGDTVSDKFYSECCGILEENEKYDFCSSYEFNSNPCYEGKILPSLLNIKPSFDFDGIADLKKFPFRIHASVNSVVFKKSFFSGRRFNTTLKYEWGEDLLLKALCLNPEYPVAVKSSYFHFLPQEDDALYYIPANNNDWYKESLTEFLIPLVKESKKLYFDGTVPDFIQYYVMYYLQCRFMSNMNNRAKRTMNNDELKEYFGLIGDALKYVDDSFILRKERTNTLNYSFEASFMFMYIKYGTNALDFNINQGDNQLYLNYNGIHISTITPLHMSIHVMDYQNGKLQIDGSFREVFYTENLEIYAVFNGVNYILNNNDRYSLTKFFTVSAYKKFTFHLELELDEELPVQQLQFYVKYKKTNVLMPISFIHHWAKLSATPKNNYWHFRNYIAVYENRTIIFKKATKLKLLVQEAKMLTETLSQSKRLFIIRMLYDLTLPYFKNKKIWVLYDKLYKGGDSSEYLYRYCAGFKDGITKYYVIDKNTADYKRLKKDGYKPVKNNSLLHKMAFLHADIIMITNSNVFPFSGYSMDRSRFIRGLCNFSTMCLQHGLTVQKCAMAQQRVIDNTRMYFIASKYEEKNLNHHAYNYKGFDIIRLTGIGRYDGLINNDQRQILISPTWRMYNAMPVTKSEGVQRDYNPEYKNTLYFKIYNDLINDSKLISTAKKCGYKIKYLLHPILSAQADDYTPNSEVEVIPSVGDLNYEKILTESSLMVTDYSGVQFDFAYMKKPLVYFHPDELPAHYEDGCFFYDTMGFGEICKTSQQLVDVLCEYMENNCVMKPKYVRRVEDFYYYNDHNNCKRIYDEIIKYQKIVDRDKNRKS